MPTTGARPLNSTGTIYVADTGNSIIRKITNTGGTCVVSTLAGLAAQSGNVDGTGPSARFNLPSAIATDGTNLYVGDVNVVRQVAIASGAVSTIAGDLQNQGAADGIGPAAHLGFIEGLALDGKGTLFMSDTPNLTTRQLTLATGEVQTIAGMVGVSGNADGVGPAATFAYPADLALDMAGNLFVADVLNDTIRELSP